MGLNLELNQVQSLKLSANLINAINLLELNASDMEGFIKKEFEENVVLEYKPSKLTGSKKYNLSEEDNFENYIKKEETISDFLKEQLLYLNLSKEEIIIGYYIIENIDDDGYLRLDIKDIAEKLHADLHIVEKLLNDIKKFEPIGIASSTLEECLLRQVDKDDEILNMIIKKYLDDISRNKFREVSKELNISIKELNTKVNIIKSLNPKPTAGFLNGSNKIQYIVPDFFVDVIDSQLSIKFREDYLPKLYINNYYLNLLNGDLDKDTKSYVEEKLNSADFLIKSIEKRSDTIQRVIFSIVEFQRDFFIFGKSLRVMKLKDIEEITGLSKSTISRVSKNKYLECGFGIFSINYFFQSGISGKDSGESISKNFISERIKMLIENEDKKKPLSDQKIVEILIKDGIDIKRRTVAKYRTEMNIDNTSIRRSFDE